MTKEITELQVRNLRNAHLECYRSGVTLDVTSRKTVLIQLRDLILAKEEAITEALKKDFGKSRFETMATETQFVLGELHKAIKNLHAWARPKSVRPSLVNFPSRDRLYPEPYGNTLIIAPWNYPFNLAITPLIGALAAGNTAVIKPSELTPHTSKCIKEIIHELNVPGWIDVVEGGPETSKILLELPWDYIFFTGSVSVGKIVYQAAAKHLCPVTLELGGKNPCVIHESAKIEVTARRIVWGKFLNGGQTCVAPDYLLVHHSIKGILMKAIQAEITKAYGTSIENNPDYPRIVNTQHHERLLSMLDGASVAFGGDYNKETRYLGPTLVDEPDTDSALMKEEIFGPILPIVSYHSESEIYKRISQYEKPLSVYVFSEDASFAKRIMRTIPFGGGCINDTIIQLANSRLPFGGVGKSGIGSYHGKKSFDLFSHFKPVVHRSTFLDIPLRYAPYKGKEHLAKWIHKLV